MSLEDAEPSPIPIPFTKSDPIFMALKGDDNSDDANAKIRAQIDALKKQDAKKPTQQEKMKTCNAEAKGKTGEERKDFMKSCLSS